MRPVQNSIRIAVVIPTYNRSWSIHRCLDSVFAQTRLPDEIIVVDDGSTDGSTSDLNYRYPRTRVITQDNQGVSAARNAGIRAAQSEWIAFLDSDDVWLDTKCEKQIHALEQNTEYKICHTQEKWVYRGAEKQVPKAYQKKGGWIFYDCLPVCAISPSTVIIKRDLLDSIGLFDESLSACEDYDLWLRTTSQSPVLLLDEVLIEKHGGHEDQLSNQRGLDEFRIRALEKFLHSSCTNTEYKKRATQMLIEKCNIIVNGAVKRGESEVADRIRGIRDRFR